MPSPARQLGEDRPGYDYDPAPPGSPRLLGDRVDGLKGFRRTVEMRSPELRPSVHSGDFLRDLAVCVLVLQAGFTQEQAGGLFGLGQSCVSKILSRMRKRAEARASVVGDDADSG